MSISQLFSQKKRTIIKYKKSEVTTYAFVVDCTLTENHTRKSTVTDHEVEEGSNFSDNIKNDARSVSLTGLVSDLVLFPFQITTYNLSDEEDQPSQKAYDIFEEIHQNKYLCTVETTLDLYENAVLESITMPRDKNTRKSFRFSCTFKEIRAISSKITEIENTKLAKDDKKKAQNKVKTGGNVKKSLTDKEELTSVLYDIGAQ